MYSTVLQLAPKRRVLNSPAAGAQTQSTQQSRLAPRPEPGVRNAPPGTWQGNEFGGVMQSRNGCCRQSFSTTCGLVASPRTQAREGPASVCSTVLRLAPKRRVLNSPAAGAQTQSTRQSCGRRPDSEPGVRNAPPGTWQGNEFGRVTQSRSGCCRQSFSTTCGLVATPRTQAREGPASVYSTVLRLAPKRRVLNSPAAGAQTQSTQQSCGWRPNAEYSTVLRLAPKHFLDVDPGIVLSMEPTHQALNGREIAAIVCKSALACPKSVDCGYEIHSPCHWPGCR